MQLDYQRYLQTIGSSVKKRQDQQHGRSRYIILESWKEQVIDVGINKAVIEGATWVDSEEQAIFLKTIIHYEDPQKTPAPFPSVFISEDGKWLQTYKYLQDQRYNTILMEWIKPYMEKMRNK